MTKEDWLNLWWDMVRSAAKVDCLSYPDDDDLVDDVIMEMYYSDLYMEYN